MVLFNIVEDILEVVAMKVDVALVDRVVMLTEDVVLLIVSEVTLIWEAFRWRFVGGRGWIVELLDRALLYILFNIPISNLVLREH